MADPVSKYQLRSFGLTVGGIFAGLGFWPFIVNSENVQWWPVVTGAGLVLTGIVLPRFLFWIYKSWMILGHALGWINTRIVLGVIFYGLVTPIGIFRRWLGKDSMGRDLRSDLASYRIDREARPPSHMKKQY